MVPTGEFVSGGFRIARRRRPRCRSTPGRTSRPRTTARRCGVRQRRSGRAARLSGAITTSTGALKIGGNAIWGEWFKGDIDEIRIYNRALTATEIQADMNTSISCARQSPPSAPGTLTATGGLGQIALAWGAATDNVSVARYNVHRGSSAGFIPSLANRIAQPTGTSYTDAASPPAPTSTRSPPRTSPATSARQETRPARVAAADTTPPTVAITAPASGATVSASVSVTANAGGQRHRRRRPVQARRSRPRRRGHDGSLLRDLGQLRHRQRRRTRSPRWHATAPATRPPLRAVPVTVSNTGSLGLVGAWAFDEGSGTTTADQSGRGNAGTLANAAWVTTGKFNNALSFNGTNAWVTVADSAHARPDDGHDARGLGAAGRRRRLAHGGREGPCRAGSPTACTPTRTAASPAPRSRSAAPPARSTAPPALPVGTWSHVAATYDGTMLRLYVNGSQVGAAARRRVARHVGLGAPHRRQRRRGASGSTARSTRCAIYNRALAAGEIQNDMPRSITPDTVAPTITARTPAPGSAGINAGTSATVTVQRADERRPASPRRASS